MRTKEVAPPPPSVELRRLAAAELSLVSRIGYVLLLLVALGMTLVIAALWLTEPSLPRRAQAAFAVMLVIGVSWVAFAIWVLTRRHALFARDRVIAGRMALTFAIVFLAGALGIGIATGRSAPFAAAALGAAMVAVAALQLARARRLVKHLIERRDALQRELGRSTR
jgi:hypothetical protein